MSRSEEYIRKLNEIDELTIFVDANNMICVRLTNYDAKDSCGVIVTKCGRGTSLLFALQDYVKEISGKTLINIKNDTEIRVLIIDNVED